MARIQSWITYQIGLRKSSKRRKANLAVRKGKKNKRESQVNKRQFPPFKVPIINPPSADNSGFLSVLTGPSLLSLVPDLREKVKRDMK